MKINYINEIIEEALEKETILLIFIDHIKKSFLMWDIDNKTQKKINLELYGMRKDSVIHINLLKEIKEYAEKN